MNGTPNTPCKFDKNNCQGRTGTAYQLNEKTVLRAGYGKYFLNPTGQGVHQRIQPGDAADRVERRRPHADLPAVQPVPDGVQTPPGSSLGPLTFLGRGPTSAPTSPPPPPPPPPPPSSSSVVVRRQLALDARRELVDVRHDEVRVREARTAAEERQRARASCRGRPESRSARGSTASMLACGRRRSR